MLSLVQKISKVLLLSLCLLATKRNLFSSQLLVCGPFCSSTPRKLSFPSQHCCFVCYLCQRNLFLLITTYIPFVMTNRAMLSVINSMLSVNLHTFCTLDFFQFVCFVFLLFFYFLVFVLLGVFFCLLCSFFLSFLFIWALAVVFFAFVWVLFAVDFDVNVNVNVYGGVGVIRRAVSLDLCAVFVFKLSF